MTSSTLKRCMSPMGTEDGKRVKRDSLSKLTDKFMVVRGRLHQLSSSSPNKENVPPKESTKKRRFRVVNVEDRNYYVGALYTLTTNLGLLSETIHIAIDLLDRFLIVQPITIQWLEVVSIACIWIASKFNETQANLEKLRVKQILQQRDRKGNWSWHHVLVIECQILKRLSFRIIHPTMLSRYQRQVADGKISQLDQAHTADAHYFLDLTLLDATFHTFKPLDVLEAISFLSTKFQPDQSFDELESRLREPITRFFFLHLKIQQELLDGNKLHKALHCKHGDMMSTTWQLKAANIECACRLCAVPAVA
ncbi:hypothetical protein THRCLA_10835 [Thraustotheca clavata]|uniref:Cyclin N-terminal domain-containing protein n=1 Tax=Thraustotheca clavata TaxID=74557 RepID=A0A1V9YF58_9STRA|nr:hypothetical protein THRCLA_10835 [Thraustotheca clavata]